MLCPSQCIKHSMYLINVHGDDDGDGNGENTVLSKKCVEFLTSLSN